MTSRQPAQPVPPQAIRQPVGHWEAPASIHRAGLVAVGAVLSVPARTVAVRRLLRSGGVSPWCERVVVVVAADVWQRLADLVVEQAKAAGPGDPAASRFPVPWGPQQLDGGVWLARSAAEQSHERGRCFEQTRAIAHSEGTSYRRLSPRSKAVFGVDDAARWTGGSTLASPLSRVDTLVNGHNLVHEMDLAMEVVRLRADEWEKAIGAYVWLRWLTGADEAITYPLW